MPAKVIFYVDEFGPLNLQPRPGRQWAAVSGKNAGPAARHGAGQRGSCQCPASHERAKRDDPASPERRSPGSGRYAKRFGAPMDPVSSRPARRCASVLT